MRAFRRHARAFWVVVLLLVAGGQLAHAWSDCCETVCESSHSEEGESHNESNGAEPTSPQHCCHAHTPANVAAWEPAGFLSPILSCGDLPAHDDSFPESPVREIDLPPQLS